ncbi:MAG: hypothetical protein IT369_05355 [Candidatus Latescibacteria bacterium]|nr:hypothetical protein [Candidatus Latescibacterota bacterium]
MSSLVGLLLLLAGFAVLVQTFAWIARAVERRAASASACPPAPLPAEEEAPQPSLGVILQGANYGLVLGVLACLLFKVWPPLMVSLSAAGIGFSGRTLVQGWRRYEVLVYRALAGLALSLVSVALHYLNLTGQLPDLGRLAGG